MLQEIKTKQRLLSSDGTVSIPGWSRYPVWIYDRRDIRASSLRISEWDRYLIIDDELCLELYMADLGYAGVLSASLIDMYGLSNHGKKGATGTPTEMCNEQITAFTRGRMGLVAGSASGTQDFRIGGSHMRFAATPGRRRVRARIRDFYEGEDLQIDLRLLHPDRESLCTAGSWGDRSGSFLYTQRVHCLPVRGAVEIGKRCIKFEPERNSSILEWGRAVFPADTEYSVASCSTIIDGEHFGFCLANSHAGGGSIRENALYHGGRIHKPGEVFFRISGSADGSKDYMNCWSLTSAEGRFEAVFIPDFVRDTRIGRGLSSIKRKQVIGKITGTALLDDNSEIKLRDVPCVMEIASSR